MKSNDKWSRRKFINTLAGSGAAFMLNPQNPSSLNQVDPRVAKIVAGSISVDTHNHLDVPLLKENVPGPDLDLAAEMKKSGFSAICATFALDYQKLDGEGVAYERFLNGLDSVDHQIMLNGMKRALNLADLQAAHNSHQPTIIQSVEGSHFLEGKIERLAAAYARGFRHLCLLHDSDASVPLGDVFTNPVRYNGLTAFGKAVIKECNRLGIVVDMSHGSNDTINAALKVATHPILVSHTGLNTELGSDTKMGQMFKPRLISKEQAKIVADAGGVIGVWTHLSDSALEYARHVRALVDVVGIDHVCIGTDTKLTPSYRPPGQGFGGPGGGRGGQRSDERIGERTNLAWKDQTSGFYFAVVDAMLKTGFSAEEIAKFGGGNYCRLFDAATAGSNKPGMAYRQVISSDGRLVPRPV